MKAAKNQSWLGYYKSIENASEYAIFSKILAKERNLLARVANGTVSQNTAWSQFSLRRFRISIQWIMLVMLHTHIIIIMLHKQ